MAHVVRTGALKDTHERPRLSIKCSKRASFGAARMAKLHSHSPSSAKVTQGAALAVMVSVRPASGAAWPSNTACHSSTPAEGLVLYL